MSSTYLVEVVHFDDLRPGDRVLHEGVPVTITAIGYNLVLPAIIEATCTTSDGKVGAIPKVMHSPLYRIIPDTPAALEAA